MSVHINAQMDLDAKNLPPLATSPIQGNDWRPIATFNDFVAMDQTHNYYLVNDIDGEGQAFTFPWLYDDTLGRQGWFDGRGFTIRNMSVDQPSLPQINISAAGILGPVTCNNAEGEYSVQNVTLENVSVRALDNQSLLLGIIWQYYSNEYATDVNNGSSVFQNGLPHIRVRNVHIKDCDMDYQPNITPGSYYIIGNHKAHVHLTDVTIWGTQWRHATPYLAYADWGTEGDLYIDGLYWNVELYPTPQFYKSVWDPAYDGTIAQLDRTYIKDGTYAGATTVNSNNYNLLNTYPDFDFSATGSYLMDTERGPYSGYGIGSGIFRHPYDRPRVVF